MGARQREWAKAWRARILRILGPRCACCGATEDLTFDCIRPGGGNHARLEHSQRITFYRRQFSVGNLQVLCRRCNINKSDRLISLSDLLREVNRENNSVNPSPHGTSNEKPSE